MLKRLPEALQDALRSGQLSLTQGYLFSDYLDNPELLSIFQTLLTNPVTAEKLKEQLDAYAKRSMRSRPKNYRPFAGIHTSIKNAGMTVGDQAAPVTRDDLAKLLDALHALAAQVKGRIAALPPEEGA